MRRAAACTLTLLIALAGASAVSAAPAANGAAGAATRWQYTQTPPNPPYGSLDDVSCVSSTFCLAVGTIYVATTTAGVEAPLAEVRGRSGWRRLATSGLPGTITALGRVACGRARRCLALTDGPDAEPVWWTGRRWRVAPLPNPAQDHPADLDCASGTSCMVVGQRGNLAWSWRWNGRRWTSVPSTRAKVTYRDVSCPRTTLCRAVGVRVARDGSRHAVVSLWSGRRWSLHDLPAGRYGVVDAIDCSTATSCTAAGHIDGTRGRALVETLTGHAWHASRPALPRGSNLRSISCRSPIRCTAVVIWCCTSNGYPRYGLGVRGTDGVWRTGPTTGSLYHALYAISCSPAACSTVGSGTVRPLAFRGPGLRPRREAVPAPRSPAHGAIWDVSCAPGGFCAAASATAAHPIVHPAGGRWRRTGGDGPSDLESVSCSSPSFCMAVQHAARWDGHRWRVAQVPAGSGEFLLQDVDCLNPTWCDAVGFRDPFESALIEHWDGVRWRVVTPPRPKLPALDGIDCVSTTDCLAVGGGDALRWDGTRWRVLDTTGVPSDDAAFDLSCWDTNRCLAVYASGRVARFDGTRFTTTPVGPDVNPRMTAVACRAADACVAVGRAGSPGHRHGVVQSWDGTRWRAVPGPSVAFSHLESVSCSAQECWAGGSLYRNPRAAEYPLLAVIR